MPPLSCTPRSINAVTWENNTQSSVIFFFVSKHLLFLQDLLPPRQPWRPRQKLCPKAAFHPVPYHQQQHYRCPLQTRWRSRKQQPPSQVLHSSCPIANSTENILNALMQRKVFNNGESYSHFPITLLSSWKITHLDHITSDIISIVELHKLPCWRSAPSAFLLINCFTIF